MGSREADQSVKAFDTAQYKELENFSRREMVERDLYERIGYEIFTKYEGFQSIHPAPALRGIPFDYLGFKDEMPHLIVFRDPVNLFRTPATVLINRLEAIMRRIDGLKAVLIQVSIRKGAYRALYTDELKSLKSMGNRSNWQEESITPIEEWVCRMIQAHSASGLPQPDSTV